MVLLCMTWAFQQIALKSVAADIAPTLQIAIRSGIAAVFVHLLMRARGERLDLSPGVWRPGLLVGFLFGLEFVLAGLGLQHTSASHMSVFLYTAPIFAALGLHLLLPSERLSRPQWVGIVLAFAGVAIAFFGRSEHADPRTSLFGDFLGVLAGLSWGLTTVAIRGSRLATVSATTALLYQLLGGFVMLLATAVAAGQTGVHWTPLVGASLAFQSVVVSFASFLAWFWLLRRYVAAQLGVFAFMTPLFGVTFGVLLLGEPVERSFAMGAVLVVAGILLVSGSGWLAQVVERKAGRSRQA